MVEKDGRIRIHEVKGWWDRKSKTQMKRMTKYYPDVDILVIDQEAYYAIKRDIRHMIPHWE